MLRHLAGRRSESYNITYNVLYLVAMVALTVETV